MERSGYVWRAQAEDDGWRKGPWTAQEDMLLIDHVNNFGEGSWNSVAKLTGLKRSGKSCRLRWVNYLRPDLKKGKITPEEENIIVELQALWGNRWSTIARSLPGRTDNEIKNYWRTQFKKSRPSRKVERARTRFLMHRQEEKMKQGKLMEYELQQQQQQQLLQKHEAMSMAVSQLMATVEEVAPAQDGQEEKMKLGKLMEYELQQQQQQQQQQLLLQKHEAMSMAVSQLLATVEEVAPAQDGQDMVTCLCPLDCSLLHCGSDVMSGTSDCSRMAAAMEEDVGLWGSLWN